MSRLFGAAVWPAFAAQILFQVKAGMPLRTASWMVHDCRSGTGRQGAGDQKNRLRKCGVWARLFGCWMHRLVSTSCRGRSALPQHLRAGVYSAHASSLRLRSAGAHFVRRPVGLASARSVLRRGDCHNDCSGTENGPPKADKLFDRHKGKGDSMW